MDVAPEVTPGPQSWEGEQRSPFAHRPPTQRVNPRMALGSVSFQGSPAKPAGRWVGRERGVGLDLDATRAEAHRLPLGTSSLTPVEFLMSQGWYFPPNEGS